MQVIGNTVMTNLMSISEMSKNDRLLQKSMVGNLHQWLIDQSEQFLQEEFQQYSGF